MQKIFAPFGSPAPLLYLLPWFMLLLLLGTVAQRYIGLIEAQRLFFSSWILWLGPVPTPGGITTLALITLNLLCRLMFCSPWQRERIGTILAHLGVLMLMLGGAVTWLVHQEGTINLLEGESTQTMQDYYERELTLYESEKPIARWHEEKLKPGALLQTTPFSLKVTGFCSNCQGYVQEKPEGKRGLARKLRLEPAPSAKEKEENKAGVTVLLEKGNQANGEYLAYELLGSRSPEWNFEGKHYRLVLARKSYSLPFTLTLLDFEKIRYPGSEEAKEYRSQVAINENGHIQEATISMNEPLRLHGYAIYQSSFIQIGNQQASILSVVKNDAWLAPYVSTFILAWGLLWHLYLRLQRRGTGV